jgi:hypothetical protein
MKYGKKGKKKGGGSKKKGSNGGQIAGYTGKMTGGAPSHLNPTTSKGIKGRTK